MVGAVLKDLSNVDVAIPGSARVLSKSPKGGLQGYVSVHTFLSTLEETLGSGIGWSVSPMSVDKARQEKECGTFSEPASRTCAGSQESALE